MIVTFNQHGRNHTESSKKLQKLQANSGEDSFHDENIREHFFGGVPGPVFFAFPVKLSYFTTLCSELRLQFV